MIQIFLSKNKLVKITLILSFVVVFSCVPIFMRRADAQIFVPVNDYLVEANTTIQNSKDLGWDALAWQVANMVLSRMAASTVNWINNGFQGSPAYITNSSSYFTSLADQAAGLYIYSNSSLNYLCSPLQAKIKIALANTYTRGTNTKRYQCTLSSVVNNIDNFMNNFSDGGWEGFFALTQNPNNNAIGMYLQAENEMYDIIGNQQANKQNEINQGKGFLSYKKCKAGTEQTSSAVSGSGTLNNTADTVCESWDYTQTPPVCKKYSDVTETNIDTGIADGDCAESDKETVTPGSVIETQLNSVLGSGTNKLQVADEINEIVSALLNQLVNQVVGGLGSLAGSSKSSSSGSSSLTSQLSEDTSTTGYFGDTQDTSILDEDTSSIIGSSTTSTSSSASTTVSAPTIEIKDSQGDYHVIAFAFTKISSTKYNWTAVVGGDEEIKSGGSGTVTFGTDGSVSVFTFNDGSSLITIDPGNNTDIFEASIDYNSWKVVSQ